MPFFATSEDLAAYKTKTSLINSLTNHLKNVRDASEGKLSDDEFKCLLKQTTIPAELNDDKSEGFYYVVLEYFVKVDEYEFTTMTKEKRKAARELMNVNGINVDWGWYNRTAVSQMPLHSGVENEIGNGPDDENDAENDDAQNDN